MVFEEQKGSTVGFMWHTNRSRGVVRVLTRAFYWLRSVTAEVPAAFRADDGRESLRFRIRKRVHHDIFDPVGMATRTAAVFVSFAWIRIELQELVHDWVGHSVAPQLFLQTISIL